MNKLKVKYDLHNKEFFKIAGQKGFSEQEIKERLNFFGGFKEEVYA